MRKLIGAVFYGNLFYGICAIALCIETNIQFGVPFNHFSFYLAIFLGTVCYYGFIYYKSQHSKSADERTLWYRKNNQTIKLLLLVFSIVISASALIWLAKFNSYLWNLQWYHLLFASLFPLASVLYVSSISPFQFLKKIRRIGWLKPFIVGFTWAGIVNIYPVLFLSIHFPGIEIQKFQLLLFWLQNFLFISALAIIFDMKDYTIDLQNKLLTYPAKFGNEKTFTYIILPLSLLSLGILFIFLSLQNVSGLQMAIQFTPYIALLILCMKFKNVADVLFYLVAVDGLMLLKATCGIAAIYIFP